MAADLVVELFKFDMVGNKKTIKFVVSSLNRSGDWGITFGGFLIVSDFVTSANVGGVELNGGAVGGVVLVGLGLERVLRAVVML